MTGWPEGGAGSALRHRRPILARQDDLGAFLQIRRFTAGAVAVRARCHRRELRRRHAKMIVCRGPGAEHNVALLERSRDDPRERRSLPRRRHGEPDVSFRPPDQLHFDLDGIEARREDLSKLTRRTES